MPFHSFSNQEYDSLYLSQNSEDLFYCDTCDIEFSLESNKIKNKKIKCPVCGIILHPWRESWKP